MLTSITKSQFEVFVFVLLYARSVYGPLQVQICTQVCVFGGNTSAFWINLIYRHWNIWPKFSWNESKETGTTKMKKEWSFFQASGVLVLDVMVPQV